MATDYRKDKLQVYGCFLTKEEAKEVSMAIEKAAKKLGVTNNRKARLSLIEIARHYNKS